MPSADSSSSHDDASRKTAHAVLFDVDSDQGESSGPSVSAGTDSSANSNSTNSVVFDGATSTPSTGLANQQPSHTVEKTDSVRGVRLTVPRAHRGLPSARLPDGAPPKSAFKIFDSEDEDIDF